MNQTVQPITVAGASIVIQVALLFISIVAIRVLARSYTVRNLAQQSVSSLVMWILVALVFLLMGEDMYATWGPILNPIALPTIPRDYAFFAVFFIDIAFVTILILRTGGTKRSPFTSVLLLLPSLAIFLREPAWRFLLYSGRRRSYLCCNIAQGN